MSDEKIDLKCSECGAKFKGRAEHVGAHGKCPKCGKQCCLLRTMDEAKISRTSAAAAASKENVRTNGAKERFSGISARATPSRQIDNRFTNILRLARTAELSGNCGEAEKYYTQILEIDPNFSEAWFGKGKAAGLASTVLNIRINETITTFQHAIATAHEDQRDEMKLCCADEANSIIMNILELVIKYYTCILRAHIGESYDPFVMDIEKENHEHRCEQLVYALKEISTWNVSNRNILENIMFICNYAFDNYHPCALHAIYRLKRMDPDYKASCEQSQAHLIETTKWKHVFGLPGVGVFALIAVPFILTENFLALLIVCCVVMILGTIIHATVFPKPNEKAVGNQYAHPTPPVNTLSQEQETTIVMEFEFD